MIKNNVLSYEEKIKVLKEHGYNDLTEAYVLTEFGERHIYFRIFLDALEKKGDEKSVLIKEFSKGFRRFSKGFIKAHTISELLEEEERIRKILE
ncbi:hypothetical protein E5F42_20240 [Clostridioides difficile]|nr:hypothetical protein [Clostridioides difficile]EGT4645278.1 hypothetical protein [Clostridioides difficile]MCR1682123.1 hypothetical protein [Clostridioides difficile]MDS6429314.1 hypothetical protein [Clostridioides difficile]OJT78320.1 hypothetical protein BM530_04440 [Clostridioides difficile]TFZ89217.1 hypothetical protein E5F42_20240 [Clostridioides difficile]